MTRRKFLMAMAAGLVSGCISAGAGVTTGQIVDWDRDQQIVEMADGTAFYVPNRGWLSDLRPQRWVTIWYSDRNGRRVVVNYRNRNSSNRF